MTRESVLASWGDDKPFIFGETIYWRRVVTDKRTKIGFGNLPIFQHSLFVKRDGKLINITNDFGLLYEHDLPCGDIYLTTNDSSERLIIILGDKAFHDCSAFKAEEIK